MSTVFATVAVKKESCFGSSSDRAIRESKGPVFIATYQCHRRGTRHVQRALTLNDGIESCARFDGWPALEPEPNLEDSS